MQMWFSRAYPSKGILPSTASHSPTPLTIPEVLERILSFLDECTLNWTARLVCSQWNNLILALRILHHTTTIDFSLPLKKRNHALKSLPQSTRLILGSSASLYQPNFLQELDRLPLILHQKNTRHPLRELILGTGFNRMTHLLQLLPLSNTLTRLVWRVHSYFFHTLNPKIDLGMLLTVYPNLMELHLVNESAYTLEIRESETHLVHHDILPGRPIPDLLKLRSLTFRNLTVSQAMVKDIVRAASSTLKELYLWRIQPRSLQKESVPHMAFHVQNFIQHLQTCPSLKLSAFALSFAKISPNASWPGEGLITQTDLESLLSCLPTIRSWGFARSICGHLVHIPNRITTLELVRDCLVYDNRVLVAQRLHQFLCNAPCLLHLYARDISFYAEDMDLYHLYDSSLRYTSPRRPTPGESHIWACRDLQTCQLCFVDSVYGHSGQYNHRFTFGYLVRVCPKLKELEIGLGSCMSMQLDNGLVILGRLQSLERLIFWTSYTLQCSAAMSRMWAVIQPPAMVGRMMQKRIVSQWRMKLEGEEDVWRKSPERFEKDLTAWVSEKETLDESESVGVAADPLAEPWMHSKYIGTFWDVKMALEDQAGKLGLKKWWPKLQMIKIHRSSCIPGHLQRTIHSRYPFQYSDQFRDSRVV